MEKSKKLVRTIRLDEAGLNALLDRLDNEMKKTDGGSTRYRYRATLAFHLIGDEENEVISYQVSSRELSDSMINILHGGFVYKNTPCMVQLTTPRGTWSDARGTVSRCTFITGNIHEVTVTFEREIDPAQFCAAAVHAHVLVAEDDSSMARLVNFHLKQLNAETDLVENGKKAVEWASRKNYDLILMDMEMPVMDGFTAVEQLRKQGYTGIIVAATAHTQPADRERCIAVGCDQYVPKPYVREDLAKLMDALQEEPLYSRFGDDPNMIDLINAFVMELPTKIRMLEKALAVGNQPQLLSLIRDLKGEGASHGFDAITTAAIAVEDALLDAHLLTDAQKQMTTMIRLCRQVRPSNPSSAVLADEEKRECARWSP